MNDTVRVADTIGLPTMAGSVDVMRSRFFPEQLSYQAAMTKAAFLRTIRILKGPSDKLIEKVFGRVQVARIPYATAQRLIDVLWTAINFGRMRFPSPSSFLQPGFNEFLG